MFGSIISAVGNLIGGSMAADAQREANAVAERNAQRNIDLQKEFATSGVKWKVQDAREAGIHPLYALGAQTHSFSPVNVGTTPVTGMATAMSAAGQDIGRAIDATRSTPERVSAVAKTMQDLSLTRAGLENELLAAQIAKTRGQIGPAMPTDQRYLVDGQGQTASGELIKDKALERVPADPSNVSSEPGAITDVGYARTKTGWVPVPSKDVKERIEDNIIQEVLHAVRNNIIPYFGLKQNPPSTALKPGHEWRMGWDGEYYQKRVYREPAFPTPGRR